LQIPNTQPFSVQVTANKAGILKHYNTKKTILQLIFCSQIAILAAFSSYFCCQFPFFKKQLHFAADCARISIAVNGKIHFQAC